MTARRIAELAALPNEPQRPKCECGHAYKEHLSHHFDDSGAPSCMKPTCQRESNPRRCSGYYPVAVRRFELTAVLLLVAAILFALPMKAQSFRIADQVRLLSATHIVSPWSTWVSDVQIANETDDYVSVGIIYGSHNGPPVPVSKRDVLKLAPRQRCEFIDFLGAATSADSRCNVIGAPLATSAFGQVVFNGCIDGADCRPSAPNAMQSYRNISVTSRIYSYTTAAGSTAQTVGQNFDAVPWWAYGDARNPLTITGIRASAAYHTNVGLVNNSDAQPVTLTLTLYDGASHSQRDQVQVQLAPFESRQQGVTELFPLLGAWSRLNRGRAATNAYIVVTSTSDDGFFAYGSLIDSRSGDATTLEATFGRALSEGQIDVLFGAPFNIAVQPDSVSAKAFNTAALTTPRPERITDPLRFRFAGPTCSIEPNERMLGDYILRQRIPGTDKYGPPWTHVGFISLPRVREMCGAAASGSAQ